MSVGGRRARPRAGPGSRLRRPARVADRLPGARVRPRGREASPPAGGRGRGRGWPPRVRPFWDLLRVALLGRLPSGLPRLGSRRGLDRGSRSPGPLPDNVGRRLVVAQPEEARLAQPTVACPLGEADLGDQFGAGPVRGARGRPPPNKKRRWRPPRPPPGAQGPPPPPAVSRGGPPRLH